MTPLLAWLEPALTPAGFLAAYGHGLAILSLGVIASLAVRRRPATRSAVLAAALLAAAAGPLLDAVLPDIALAVWPAPHALSADPAEDRNVSALTAPPTSSAPSDERFDSSSTGRSLGSREAAALSSARDAAAESSAEAPPAPEHRGASFGLAVCVLLVAGATLAIGRLARQLAALRRLGGEADPVGDDSADGAGWYRDLAEARARLRVARAVQLLVHPGLTVPLTWGFLQPVVALPAAAARWPHERRMAVLLHELAHVKRRDWLTLTAARAAHALQWASPVAWWATRRLVQAQELAADRLAVSAGLRPSAYARELVQIARDARSVPNAAAGLAAARSHDVEERVMSILDPAPASRTRSPLGTVASVALFALVVAATGALAALKPTPRVSIAAAGVTALAPPALPAALPPVAASLAAPQRGRAAQPPATPPAPSQPAVEDGGEVDDLESLGRALGALESRLRPFEEELRSAEQSLRPFEEQIRAIELEAREREVAMREVERALETKLRDATLPHEERLAGIEQRMRPVAERIRSIEEAMRPLTRELERRAAELEQHARLQDRDLEQELAPIQQRLEQMQLELEPHLAELEQLHEQMEPVHERLEAAHRELEPLQAELETLHERLEPFHRQMEAVHGQMEPIHEEMERIHERMEPLHREMEALHRRVERALEGELREVLARELGTGVPSAVLDSTAARLRDLLDVNVSNGWLRVRGSAPELRAEIERELDRANLSVDAARVQAAARAILELQARVSTGRE